MRVFLASLALFLSACGSKALVPATAGPRLHAELAASWPTAGPARQPVFSRDGKLAAFSDASGSILLRDTSNWRVVERLQHEGGATALAFGADGTHLFSAGYDATVREWDLNQRRSVRVFKGPHGTVWTLDISPDGKRLAAAGEDTIIRIWSLNAADPPALLRGHTRNVWEVRFSPDGKWLASGGFDDSVRLWDVDRARAVRIFNGHRQAVVGLDFSPDGKLLVSGGDDSTIRYWRVSDGAALRTIDNGTHVDKIAFSPDGQWIASGGHPHGLVGELWHQLTGGGGQGDAARLWRTNDAALIIGLPHPDDVYWVVFSKDGNWLITSGEDNRFRLWRLKAVG